MDNLKVASGFKKIHLESCERQLSVLSLNRGLLKEQLQIISLGKQEIEIQQDAKGFQLV